MMYLLKYTEIKTILNTNTMRMASGHCYFQYSIAASDSLFESRGRFSGSSYPMKAQLRSRV